MTLLGTALLCAAAAVMAASTVLWMLVATGRRRLRRLPVALGWSAVACALGAAATMLTVLLTDPTALAYAERVVEPGMPTYYRVTSLWAGMEGSLLLWLVATASVAAAFTALAVPRLHRVTASVAAGVLNLVTFAFALIALAVHPFAPGGGEIASRPSPLLQDHPAMGLHPPLLYVGFTLLAVPFALAIGAAAARRWDARWQDALHRWTVLAWVPLTLGIVLGAWWSYAVLGWGGYWAWDPVENASLLPWLAATASIHAIGTTTRRASALRWAVLFALLGYVLVLLATFLTRSGVVASIHAFSVSPVGPLLLVLLLSASLVALLAALLPGRLPGATRATVPGRDIALLVHRWGMLAVAVIVLAGSILPASVAAMWGERVSVGPPWYERTLAPIAAVLLVAMAIGPWLGRRRTFDREIGPAAVAAAVAAGVVGLTLRDLALTLTAGIAAFVLVGTLTRALRGRLRERASIGSALAHIGAAVAALSIAAGGATVMIERTVPVGGVVTAGELTAVLVAIDETAEQRRTIESARVLIADAAGTAIVELRPELRWYDEHGVVLAGPAIRSELWRDIYVTLLGVDAAEGVATIRLAINPMMSWLWGSAGIAALGVAVAGWPTRRIAASSLSAPRRESVAA